jgi:cytochrome c oxidase assembly factor CtaG
VAKLLFVVVKMNLFPFTSKTWVSILIIGFTFGAFYFWDFPWNPIVNIVLKSGLLTIVYVGLNYFAVISEDINEIINKSLRFIK